MANPVVTNIVTGGATIWYAPVGEALPDENTAFGGAWGGNWAKLGYTKAPITLAYEDEWGEASVEEALTPVKRWRIGESFTLETVLSELIGAYLNLVVHSTITTTAAGVSQVGFEEIDIGGEADLDEYAYGIEAKYVDASSPANEFPIRVFVWKANAKLNGQLEFSNRNNDYPGIPLQIMGMADTSQAAGAQLFRWQRVTAPAT